MCSSDLARPRPGPGSLVTPGQAAVLGCSHCSTSFAYLPVPTLRSIMPAVGAISGGTDVTLHGAGFAPGAVVLFDSLPATDVTVVNPTTLRVLAPAASQVAKQARASGALHGLSAAVLVRTPGGTSDATTPLYFTYL